MEQQKVFATAWRGFEKKSVLDYIYEQDVQFKKKEAEWNEQLAEYENKLNEQGSAEDEKEPSEFCQQQIEALEQACNDEREIALNLQEQVDRLRRDSDQLIQAARSKEGELQLQLELNRQLQQKCEVLEEKLQTLAQRLVAEREAAVCSTTPSVTVVESQRPEPQVKDAMPPFAEEATAVESAGSITTSPFSDLKEELDDFRQSVGRTLLNFETALARLEEDQPPKASPSEDSAFFQ